MRLCLAGLNALSLALFTTLPARAERGVTGTTYEGQSIDEMVTSYMKEHKVPGMALAVAQAPYVTRVTGYGFSDAGRKLLSSSNTLFHLSRMAEAYTAVAVLQLVEQGKVKLDDPIEQHVPLAPQAWHGVTVQQLLQHQSGLPDYTKAPRNPNDQPGDLFKAVSETGPTFPPGTNTASSATDYLLLQLLIETASGQSYEDFVRNNQFNRLGLKQTFFAAELNKIERELPGGNERHRRFLQDASLINPTEPATGYQEDSSKPITAPDTPVLPVRAAIYASAEDVSIWALGLSGEILIKNPDLRKLLFSPAKLKDGKTVPTSGPWGFPGRTGAMVASGDGQGFSVALMRYTDPKDLLCVTVLANKEGLDLTDLAAQIAAAYDPSMAPPKPAPSPTAAPSATSTPAPSATAKPKPSETPKEAPKATPTPAPAASATATPQG